MLKNTCLAVAFAAFTLVPTASRCELTIEQLVVESGLSAGAVAMRDVAGYDAARKIIIRDVGIDLSNLQDQFADLDIVIVRTVDEAMQHAPTAGALIGYCDAGLIAAAPELKWVQIFSAGVERCLGSVAITEGRVVLTNMQKMSSPTIAEHAIAMLLALTRSLPRFSTAMHEGAWANDRSGTAGMTTIAGKTMLVLGLGGIGTEIARRASALGMRVIATRNSSREGPDFVDHVGLSDEVLSLVADADVIVNSLPLTDATRGVVDARLFAAARRGTYFINVGRGATVDTDALLAALQNGQLAGAGLDVTDPEPLPADHPLWKAGNVIITPHVSARGSDRRRHQLLLLENLKRYSAGEPLYNVVDPSRGY